MNMATKAGVLLKPCWMGLRLLLLSAAFFAIATCSSNTSTIVTTLPGYSGELPFTFETGYIGVGENETVQLFYYFVESQRSPSRDPLLIWITAGPGCSGLGPFFFESGPLTFKLGDYNGSLPTLHDNPWAWTQTLNIIYLDAPVGAGFSYSESQEGYEMDDYKYVAQVYEFLQKWLSEHSQFLNNQLYVGGESFGGKPVPMIVQQIVIGNEAGSVPLINLKGYVIGGPATDSFTDANARIPYAHRLTLISDQLYESAKESCNGNYVDVDSGNYQCSSDIDAIDKLIGDINTQNILEPNCVSGSPEPNDQNVELVRRYLSEKSTSALWCRSYNHMLSYVWANNKGVQEALGVREGTKTFWQYCNTTLDYTSTVTSVVGYHRNLTNADLRCLIYSGDHDMTVPNIGTQEWIRSLNLTVDESWRVWSVNGQTAGYTKKLISDNFTLIYATLKGGGHIAAENMVKECAAMIDRWMAYFPL
ncbi:serine carboxypeptidase-like 13 [Alnus glutinosa]|uniref:serine carboxypeptidase-like 13 n=1 Tax=Alnus glutinosa TaxID=3517 RepID=UPI002D76E82B|nr:serine carboxypeptidase-like 13 [Alnus glutinosa]